MLMSYIKHVVYDDKCIQPSIEFLDLIFLRFFFFPSKNFILFYFQILNI